MVTTPSGSCGLLNQGIMRPLYRILVWIEQIELAIRSQFDILHAMARPRKSDSVINGIVEQYTRQLAGALSGFIASHTARAVTGKRGRRLGRGRGRRGRVLCYYPGCKNLAAPRFGMFCAAEHKDLSKSDK